MLLAATPTEAQGGPPAGPGSIQVVQTPSGGGGICLPPALALRQSTRNDGNTFRLIIRVTAPCAHGSTSVAAIYKMPGNGVAWPQTLVQSVPFTLRAPGVTEVIFTKGCDPVQFDVITGATPPKISPQGPFHGPLLFPFDRSTSLQWCGLRPTLDDHHVHDHQLDHDHHHRRQLRELHAGQRHRQPVDARRPETPSP